MSYPIIVSFGKYHEEIDAELARAQAKHGPMHSGHEGWAVIKEELDEMWEAVRRDDIAHARKEALQVAAMALRFLVDVKEPEQP